MQVNDSWYAARPARIGSEVIVRIFEREREIRDMTTMALLRRHPLAYKKGEVLLPDAERIFNPSRQTRQILRQAEDIGPNAHALCQRLFDKRGREAQKSMWGIVALVPRLPARIVEQAATLALARNVRSSKAVRVLAEQLLAQAFCANHGVAFIVVPGAPTVPKEANESPGLDIIWPKSYFSANLTLEPLVIETVLIPFSIQRPPLDSLGGPAPNDARRAALAVPDS